MRQTFSVALAALLPTAWTSTLRLVTIVLMHTSLTGCFGIGIIHSKVEECPDRVSLETRVTKEALKTYWGTPNKIITAEQEQWIYYDGLSWAGVFPNFIIGIPLALPTGRDWVEITFAEEKAVHARRSRTGMSGVVCAFIKDIACSTDLPASASKRCFW